LKEGIHPETSSTTIYCACGEEYETISTGDDIRVEVCSSCHPFYTGKQRTAARGGRVERFNEKYGRVDTSEAEEAEEESQKVETADTAETAEKN